MDKGTRRQRLNDGKVGVHAVTVWYAMRNALWYAKYLGGGGKGV